MILLCYIAFRDYENSPLEDLHERRVNNIYYPIKNLFSPYTPFWLAVNVFNIKSVRKSHKNKVIADSTVDMLLGRIFDKISSMDNFVNKSQNLVFNKKPTVTVSNYIHSTDKYLLEQKT